MSYSDPRSPGHKSKRPTRKQRAQRTPAPDRDVHAAGGERLQKVLAAAGLGSRRSCEQLITDGRVMVDGQQVRELGVRIDPQKQSVTVDGMPIVTAQGKVYLALNKPAKVMTTMNDPEGRRDLNDFLRGREERLFHVGRLDYDTEGLLLLTNDGELANRLTHPRYGIRKTYLAEVRGQVARDVGKRLKQGIELEDGLAHADEFKVVDSLPGYSLVEITLHEGRNRIVRRMLEEVGYPVLRLVRIKFGPIDLAEQRQGKLRDLRPDELAALFEAVGL
ncbi:rRNA pseudouridine synthase [Brevibacterium sp. 50QC2O2]|uniref:pseudouridine synthase n=1 Tax=Brevibacterium TaxID=1696 RepID=UPI00211C6315|nr:MULTISPECIES: pseudouridine synthase [unclassified Brevibacterium]MCQ9384229.1 rRNA pseudouridine synthase [Brevibacterium sp. 68QC2CO]MCQ9388292.1 rRNA pseudouridine synthase [Brevibacterium sp. 50QC2O2]